MLKGIHPAISPELLAILSEMGHGDEILFADAHFPAETFGKKVIRCDGVSVDTLLEGVIRLFELDQYVEQPVVMMEPGQGDELDLSVESRYLEAMSSEGVTQDQISRIERFSFYERSKQCSAVVLTGELAKYGNIILKKGVTPC
ncbi:L-fucose mutarotase [Vibrio ishigakensis]|uniref:L-fucose mutarotase n=1 Tax=Vibrio ishigakensis TaxID=1481914 RepID=A0A0B8NY84_9VIBR|nr:L-fucose mutarotase [Vibrio ishigakensis]GAM57287.1 L-fucose mutarotase [Vibrio ishigakensis]